MKPEDTASNATGAAGASSPDDVCIYEVRSISGECRFVGASTAKMLPYRAAAICKGAVDPYGNSRFKQWLTDEIRAGRTPDVVCVRVLSRADIGAEVVSRDGGKPIYRSGNRAAVDNAITAHIMTLPRETRMRLLNGRYGKAVADMPNINEFIHLPRKGEEWRVERTRPLTRTQTQDARYGCGVVFGLYHKGKLIYIGTTAHGKRRALYAILQRGTKTKIGAYLSELWAKGAAGELTMRKLATYQAGERMRVYAETIKREDTRYLLNERIDAAKRKE